MPGQYETANVTYKGLTDGKLTVTLIDEKKGKWQIWKADYKDKTKDSDAYAALQQFKFGDTFGVSYQEKDESFVNEKGQTINFKKRTIYSIMPVVTNPTSQIKPQPKYEPIAPDKQTDWDKIAVGKCQTVFLQALIQSGKTISEAKLQAVAARQLAELVVYGTQKTDQTTDPIPEPPPEVTGENIPF